MTSQTKKPDLVAVRDEKTGQFLPGNPGRAKGSKNRITLLKAALEEGFREANEDKLRAVLDMVVDLALAGDKAAIKMVWESAVSKGLGAADKEAKTDKGFTVHHVHHDKPKTEGRKADSVEEKEDG